MQVCYVDASVIVAMFLGERVPRTIKASLDSADEVLSSNLLEAEVFATAKREKIDLVEARPFVAPISLFTPDRKLASELERVFAVGYCRGADAYHLACALYIAPQPEDLVFLTLDAKQQVLAKRIGFTVK